MKRNNKKLDSKDPRYMTEEQEQIVNLILSNNELKSGKDVSNIFNELRGKVIQRLLDAEMEEFLGYDKSKHGEKENKNRRNGYTSKAKKVKTDTGEITICPPRDRDGKFEPQIVKKRQRVLEGFDEIAIAMYAKGMSLKDISEMIQHIYKVELSIETISKLTSSVSEEVKKWQERPLEDIYAVVYLDAIHFHVRSEGRIIKKAVYIAIGINMEGQKEVLGMWVGENESAKFWLSVLNSIKARGVEDIMIACIDGLTGFTNAIEAVYPRTEIQQCIIHQIRNTTKFVSYKDIKALMADLKRVYAAVDEQTALSELDSFDEKWSSKYPKIAISWRANWANLSTYFKYPEAVRTLIYTTNTIEGFNRQLRKVTKNKSVFPTDDSLLKMLYLAMIDITKKWTGKRKDWGQIHSQLEIFFADRLPQ